MNCWDRHRVDQCIEGRAMIVCGTCGYDMAGIAEFGDHARCPECGVSAYVQEIELREPPGPIALSWRLCRWAIIWCTVCAELLFLGFLEPIAMLLVIVLPPVMLVAFCAGWYGAIYEAVKVARECEPPGLRRRRAASRLILVGVGLNLMVGAIYWLIGVWMLTNIIDSMS